MALTIIANDKIKLSNTVLHSFIASFKISLLFYAHTSVTAARTPRHFAVAIHEWLVNVDSVKMFAKYCSDIYEREDGIKNIWQS